MNPEALVLAGLVGAILLFILKSLDAEILAGLLGGAGVAGSMLAVMVGLGGLTAWLPMAGGVGLAYVFVR